MTMISTQQVILNIKAMIAKADAAGFSIEALKTQLEEVEKEQREKLKREKKKCKVA